MAYQVKLSKKQAEAYYFIKQFIKDEGWPPTIKEVGAEMINPDQESGKGITITAANFRIKKLIELCAITRKPDRARSIKLVRGFKVVIKESKR